MSRAPAPRRSKRPRTDSCLNIWPTPLATRSGPFSLNAAERSRPSHFTSRVQVQATRGVNARGKCSGLESLPVELLLEIFALAVVYRSTSWDANGGLPLEFRLVCRHWRFIVDDTPRLWASIGDMMGEGVAKLAVERSHGLPLAVRLSYRTPLPVLNLLKKESWRWETIESYNCDRSENEMQSLSLPLLRRIRISGQMWLPSNMNAPKLRHVSCHDASGLRSFCFSDLQSLTLTMATGSNSSLADLCSTLQSSPQLEELYIRDVCFQSLSASHLLSKARPIHLPALKRLVCHYLQPEDLGIALLACIRPTFTGSFGVSLPSHTEDTSTIQSMRELQPHVRSALHNSPHRAFTIAVAKIAGLDEMTASIYSGRPFHYDAPIDPNAFGITICPAGPCSSFRLASILRPLIPTIPQNCEARVVAGSEGLDLAPFVALFPHQTGRHW